MRVVGAVVMAVVGACGFSPGSANAIEPDAAMGHADGSATGSDAGTTQTGPSCYGNGLLNVCFDDPLPAQFVPSPTLLTDDDGTCTKVVTVGTRTLCVVAAQTIELASDLRATGNRPLVLIAATTLTLDAGFTIDVASRDGSNTGAGGNDAACVAPSTPEGDTGGGGGGAGGSFGGKGGDGGIGDGNNNGGFDGTAAPGIATDAVTPTVVRGGCKGGVAGGDSPNNAGRAGGSSGGAVYLIAGTVLTINGTIDASGAGGQASNTEQGGPGGGSGGMIGFDAPRIDFTGNTYANGGGGAEGGTNSANGSGGNAGGDGQRSTTMPGLGGDLGTTDAGHGGNGSVGGAHDGDPGEKVFGGGGGGGGGAGYLYSFGTLGVNTGQRSPS